MCELLSSFKRSFFSIFVGLWKPKKKKHCDSDSLSVVATGASVVFIPNPTPSTPYYDMIAGILFLFFYNSIKPTNTTSFISSINSISKSSHGSIVHLLFLNARGKNLIDYLVFNWWEKLIKLEETWKHSFITKKKWWQ